MEFEKRIEKIREFISNKKIDAFFTKNQSHIFYLTGLFEIDGILLIDEENLYLFVSPLYLQECLDSFEYNKSIKNLYIKKLKNNNFQKFISRYKKVNFIETEISLHTFKNFKKQTKTELIGIIDDIILNMRMKKEREEIEFIKKAEEITKKTMEKIKAEIKEGITELDLTAEIKYQIIKNGARKESFEPIVASGINSSYPHHKSKNKKIKNGEVIVIDMGADFCGYKSDLTESFFCGKVDDEIKKIYKIVEETRKICIEYCENENLKGKDIYKKAVENFKKYNLEKFFIHGLGHGVGIDVHEKPYLNKKGNEKIEEGFVFTIEPGIYLPAKFGLRLESTFFK